MKVRIGSLESKLSSGDTGIGKLDLQIASINSELDEAKAEPELTKRRLCFAEDAASLIWEQVQTQETHLRQLEATCVAAEVGPATVESSFQSRTA